MNKLKIEYVDIDTIKPNENNVKLHPEEQIEQIKLSIQRNEFNDPIGVKNNVIIEGHGRWIACKELGIKEVPIIRLDHLTDEQALEYMLTHNQLTMNSGNDTEKLEFVLEKIDFDMGNYGFEINIPEPAKINGNNEIDLEEYNDDQFDCECPKCHFKFNLKDE